MSTFAELKTQFEVWMIDNNTQLTGETANLIKKGHREVQKRHNFKVMEATSSAYSVTSLTRKLTTVPSDWKEKRARPWVTDTNGNTKLIDWIPSEEQAVLLYDDNTTSDIGEPEYLLEVATSAGSTLNDIHVYPYPSSAVTDTITIPYWRYLPELSGDSDTDFITQNLEWVVLFHALSIGFRLNQDNEQATTYAVMAEAEFKKERNLDKKKKFGRSGVLRPRTGVHGGFNRRSF